MAEKILKSICGSPDRPLEIGDIDIPCYVLEDERRVLIQRSMVNALGMARGGSASSGGDRLAKFVSGKILSPYISTELIKVTAKPIKFNTPSGLIAYGYPGTILVDICEAVLKARDDGVLQKQQLHIAKRCEILIRGFARVGIIALIDEATGYQEVRSRNALVQILEKFIAKELQPWVKTFDDEFYKQIFRLNNWPYTSESIKKRPGVIGRWTNEYIYDRLAPGVKAELHRLVERDEHGRPKHRYFQRLTKEVGHPELREHLSAVIAVMRISNNWRGFKSNANIAFTKYGDTYTLITEEEEEESEAQLKDYLKLTTKN